MGKVDLKASFTLTLDAAVLAGVIALSTDGGLLAGLDGLSRSLLILGLIALSASALSAVWVVVPKLRAVGTEEKNFIYFGNIRNRCCAEAVQNDLMSKPVLPALAEQLHRVSKIAWSKHRAVQVALASVAIALFLLVMSFLTK